MGELKVKRVGGDFHLHWMFNIVIFLLAILTLFLIAFSNGVFGSWKFNVFSQAYGRYAALVLVLIMVILIFVYREIIKD